MSWSTAREACRRAARSSKANLRLPAFRAPSYYVCPWYRIRPWYRICICKLKSMNSDKKNNDPSWVNVNKTERVLTALAGSLLLYHTVKRHKTDSLLLLGGGYLLYRAVTGHCPIYSLREQRAKGPHNINVRTSVVVN